MTRHGRRCVVKCYVESYAITVDRYLEGLWWLRYCVKIVWRVLDELIFWLGSYTDLFLFMRLTYVWRFFCIPNLILGRIDSNQASKVFELNGTTCYSKTSRKNGKHVRLSELPVCLFNSIIRNCVLTESKTSLKLY